MFSIKFDGELMTAETRPPMWRSSFSSCQPTVPVLALELGSALAVVLVNAMPRREPPITVLEPLPMNHVVHPSVPLLPKPRDDVQRLLVNHLRNHGGSLNGSERSIAKAVGTSKPTVRRAIHALAAAGVILPEATKAGTVLKLLG